MNIIVSDNSVSVVKGIKDDIQPFTVVDHQTNWSEVSDQELVDRLNDHHDGDDILTDDL